MLWNWQSWEKQDILLNLKSVRFLSYTFVPDKEARRRRELSQPSGKVELFIVVVHF